MKLKKVAALCSSANAFCLFDRIDGDGVVTQWLGDGCCAFPLHGLPVLSERSFTGCSTCRRRSKTRYISITVRCRRG